MMIVGDSGSKRAAKVRGRLIYSWKAPYMRRHCRPNPHVQVKALGHFGSTMACPQLVLAETGNMMGQMVIAFNVDCGPPWRCRWKKTKGDSD